MVGGRRSMPFIISNLSVRLLHFFAAAEIHKASRQKVWQTAFHLGKLFALLLFSPRFCMRPGSDANPNDFTDQQCNIGF
jgi:hypothetical protein